MAEPVCRQTQVRSQDSALLNGPELASIDGQVDEWTTRQAIVVNEAKTINANDNVYFEDLKLAA